MVRRSKFATSLRPSVTRWITPSAYKSSAQANGSPPKSAPQKISLPLYAAWSRPNPRRERARLPLDSRYGGPPIDLAAHLARAARQRLGQIGGLDVAVLGMLDRADDASGLIERPDLLDLRGGQEPDVDADGGGDAGVIAVLVHAVGRAGEADVRDLLEADMLPSLALEGLVELHRIFVNLADGVADVEQRQKARSMPGRA